MAAKKKRGGRATPKGTQDPKKPKPRQAEQEAKADPFDSPLPKQAHKDQARASRPVSHNRGNR